ncbi:MAG: hypothetical protein R3A48_01030 [Polyangiales bacterium]
MERARRMGRRLTSTASRVAGESHWRVSPHTRNQVPSGPGEAERTGWLPQASSAH